MNEPGNESPVAAGAATKGAESGAAWASEPRVGALVAGLALWLAVTVVVSSLVAPFAFRAIESISPGALMRPKIASGRPATSGVMAASAPFPTALTAVCPDVSSSGR